jgi:hypothetical protein
MLMVELNLQVHVKLQQQGQKEEVLFAQHMQDSQCSAAQEVLQVLGSAAMHQYL